MNELLMAYFLRDDEVYLDAPNVIMSMSIWTKCAQYVSKMCRLLEKSKSKCSKKMYLNYEYFTTKSMWQSLLHIFSRILSTYKINIIIHSK